uniref:Uncharacterized protein n=1 Tax=Myotis myotis TaxID=51298 RepID=A0A7J7TTV0_MYOMY|nr:hypothetical protein mMyoMyo1_009011 [Myotis myotis]
MGDADRQINVPGGARRDLLHQFVFPSDNELGLGAAAARHRGRRRRRLRPSPDTSGRRMRGSGLVWGAGLRRRATGKGARGLLASRPESAEGNPITPPQSGAFVLGCSLCGVPAAPQLGHLCRGGRLASLSLSGRCQGLERGLGELGRGYLCPRLQPTQNAPSPREHFTPPTTF